LQAVQVERFGVENLKVQEVADPVPGPGEVLIATEAATINPADLAIVTGTAASSPARRARRGAAIRMRSRRGTQPPDRARGMAGLQDVGGPKGAAQ